MQAIMSDVTTKGEQRPLNSFESPIQPCIDQVLSQRRPNRIPSFESKLTFAVINMRDGMDDDSNGSMTFASKVFVWSLGFIDRVSESGFFASKARRASKS